MNTTTKNYCECDFPLLGDLDNKCVKCHKEV